MTIEEFLAKSCSIWNNGKTWQDWFEDVLLALLVGGESFSGKRPNCNSGWQSLLAADLSEINPFVVISWEEEEGHKIPYRIDWNLYQKTCVEVVKHLMRKPDISV
jgi:hypothetical protein